MSTPIPIEIKTQRYFTCPCGDEEKHIVEHLMDDEKQTYRSAGPWSCRACHVNWWIDFDKDGKLSVRDSGRKTIPTFVRLEIPPQQHPIVMIVRGLRFEEAGKVETHAEERGHKQFYYEENTCPSNYFGDVETVAINGDNDPHGLAKYIDHFDEYDQDEYWRAEWEAKHGKGPSA